MNLEKLRWKLIAAFMGVSLVPLVFFGIIVHWQGKHMIRQEVVANLSNLLENHSQIIHHFIAERTGDLKILVKMSFDDRIAITGKFISRINSMKQEYKVYRNILIVSPSGSIIFQSEDGEKKIGPFIKRKLKIGCQLKEFYIADSFVQGAEGGTSLLMAVPIITKSKLLGFLVADINFQSIIEYLNHAHIDSTGEVYLVNGEGFLLIPTRLGGGQNRDKIFITHDGIGQDKLNFDEYVDYRGKKVLHVQKEIHSTAWFLIAEQDSEEALKEINILLFKIMISVIIMMVVVFFIAMGITNLIIQLLKRLYNHEKELELLVIQKDRLASMGLLTSGLAHELNTPLANALIHAQILKEDLKDSDSSFVEAISSIEEEIKRGSQIVHGFMNFTYYSSVESEAVNVNLLIEKILQLSKKYCNDSHIQVDTVLQDTIPHVTCNPGILQQVLMNIIANAVEAMKKGGTLQVKTTCNVISKKIFIEIQDSGDGIPEKYIEKIFDPFFSTKTDEQGMGLGLYISYGMIRQMQGEIHVKSTCCENSDASKKQCGTTFIVELPTGNAD